MQNKEIGIDLGSATIMVSTAESGIIACEPSVAAIVRDNRRLYSIGSEAERDAADTAKNLRLIHPLRDGIAADADATKTMIAHVIHLTCGSAIIKPRVLIGIPFDLSDEQETLIEWAAGRAGARETFLVYTPVAAMAGMGIAPDRSVMIVDIGASRTSIMLTGDGKILYKNTVAVGGNAFDAAIVAYMQEHHHLKINSRSATIVKNKIGTLWINREDNRIDIRGKLVEDDTSALVRVSSHEMFVALEEPTARLVAAICEAINAIPSPHVGEVFARGILLCGGGAQLDGLDKMISGVTGVNAHVVDRPCDVVAEGLGKILADLPTSMKNEKVNISLRCMRMGL